MKLRNKLFIFISSIIFLSINVAHSAEYNLTSSIECETIDWSGKSGTVWYGNEFCFRFRNGSGLIYNLNPRTLFYEKIPDEISMSIGSYQGPSSNRTVLIQNIKTDPMGNILLNEKSLGQIEDVHIFPSWFTKSFFFSFILVIIGFYLGTRLEKPDSKSSQPAALEQVLFFVPLTLFLLHVVVFLGLGLIVITEEETLIDVFIDNATKENYTITINGEDVQLPSMKNLCVRLRPSRHTFSFTSKSCKIDPCILNMEDAVSYDKYVINIKSANNYTAKMVTYQERH